MRRYFLFSIITTLMLFGNAYSKDADEYMRDSQTVAKVASYQAEIELVNIDRSGRTKIRRVSASTKLKENSVDVLRYARFIEPADFRGTTTLVHEHSSKDDEIWIFQPNLKKTRKIISGGRKERFLGTEFTYGDVIGFKEGDWSNKTAGEEIVGGHKVVLIESLPKSSSIAEAYGYSKRVSYVRVQDSVLQRTQVWNTDGVLSKTIEASDIREVQKGKFQAMHLRATNIVDSTVSEIKFLSYDASRPAKLSLFKSENLGD